MSMAQIYLPSHSASADEEAELIPYNLLFNLNLSLLRS